uniref:Secreted protein n=1 Tax=Caenorhabditis tropicalis TaxID=1561998 RepID=A0A1I7U8C4_9PELO
MRFFVVTLLSLCLLLQLITAEITCNDKGVCTGSGSPAADTRCGGCHSCTFKNCCHVRFTNPYTKCNIPGWRSDEYKTING